MRKVLALTLALSAALGFAKDLGFRFKEGRCLDREGKEGLNPNYIGECGDLSYMTLSGLDLSGEDFRGALFDHANLRKGKFHNADFSYSNLSGANLEDADFTGASFRRANLSLVNASGSIFVETDLQEAHAYLGDFTRANFERSLFEGSSWEETRFRATLFPGTEIRDANFLKVDFTQALFRESRLVGIKMKGSRLLDSRFERAFFQNVDLSNSMVGGASFLESVISPDVNFAGTIFTNNTVLPFSKAEAFAKGMKKPQLIPAGTVSADPDFTQYFSFVRIRKGTFMMGSPETEPGHIMDEEQVKVEITKDFEMATTEVTQALFEKVMGFNPSRDKGPQIPVNKVSPLDAEAFIEKLNRLKISEGYLYRLPTEAEWEFAARAGSTGRYTFGDNIKLLPEYCWFSVNSSDKAQVVGQLKPNANGLYDVHGNVWEWTQDRYADRLPGGKDPLVTEGSDRIIRGGSMRNQSARLRVALRPHESPVHTSYNIGFRLAREIQPDQEQPVR